jgi:hypothetical protein
MRKSLFIIGVLGLVSSGAFAGNLTAEAQFTVSGKDATKAFLTVKGAQGSVDHDTLDAVSGASRGKSTDIWNKYARGADKKPALPSGLQSLFKYGVSPLKQFEADGLTVTKAKDGVITIQYVHFGTAYLIVTDKTGNVALPTSGKSRKIAVLDKTGSNVVSKAFSATGKVADIDWAKVWDATAGDGAVIAKVADATGKVTELKVGKVVDDTASSADADTGTVTITFDGTWVHVLGDLTTK